MMNIFEWADKMRGKYFGTLAVVLLFSQSGCAEVAKELHGKMHRTWHDKCDWKAEDYFDDPKVISLCKAIEASDLEDIDRLVAAGADVNAKGKGNMTPLLWAYPDNKLERFTQLLEHGADPNVVIESDFNSRGGMSPGDSVTHMATETRFPGYFEAVFDHGGDPNLIKNGIISNETPLFTLILGRAPNKIEKVKLLIDNGADLDHLNGTGTTPTMAAVGRAYYNIALMLLEAGANPMIYIPNSNSRLIHRVVEEEYFRLQHATPQQKADYQRLLKWLENHGESADKARAEKERWKSWSLTTGEYRRKMDAEVAARKEREVREKAVTDGDAEDDE